MSSDSDEKTEYPTKLSHTNGPTSNVRSVGERLDARRHEEKVLVKDFVCI